jgi:ribosomal protein L44E
MALRFNCSKCNSDMQQGLVVDLSYAGIIQSMWIEDQPENSVVAGIADHHKRKAKTITYRCSNCGFLDSYAK